MLAIIAHHYVVNSGVLECVASKTVLGINDYFLLLMGSAGKTGINCFVFITGYYMCQSNISVLKYARLFCEVLFYKLIIYLFFVIIGYQAFSFSVLWRTAFLFGNIADGFTPCFLLFYLLIPFLNKLLSALKEKEHICLIMWCVLVYTVLPSLGITVITYNYITWFCIVYIIASYFRIYPKNFMENKKIIGLILLMLLFFYIGSVVFGAFIGCGRGKTVLYSWFLVSDSNKILALLTAIFAFLFFKSLKMNHYKWINLFAASTFGVLQIHANSNTMRCWLWRDICNNIKWYTSRWMPIHFTITVVLVFFSTAIIDILRIRYIEVHFMEWIERLMRQNQMIKYNNQEGK